MTEKKIQRLAGSSVVLASRTHPLYRIDGQKQGQNYWAFVLIDAGKLDAFKDAIEIGHIHVESYGTLLAWGMGIYPPGKRHKRPESAL